MPSLRLSVRNATGQDVSHCQSCQDCDLTDIVKDADIPISSMVQMILYNDEEVLTSRTLWSDEIFASAKSVCKRGLDLQAVMLALREEAGMRGLTK